MKKDLMQTVCIVKDKNTNLPIFRKLPIFIIDIFIQSDPYF